MPSRSMTRTEFFRVTLTLVGGAAGVSAMTSACGSSTTSSGTGGSGPATGGAGGTGSGSGGAGGSSGAQCTNPLPESQVADATGHVHTLVVTPSLLAATSAITLQTGPFPVGSGGHIHNVTLIPANLATLRGGGSVTVTSDEAGTTPHTHMYMLSCT